MNIRTEMILDALVAGFTVVHTDLDVVFFRNPLPHLKVYRRRSVCLIKSSVSSTLPVASGVVKVVRHVLRMIFIKATITKTVSAALSAN